MVSIFFTHVYDPKTFSRVTLTVA